MSGFNYKEPGEDGNTLTAIRSESGLFYFQSEFNDPMEMINVSVLMSPDEAKKLAQWILSQSGDSQR